jgi:hypothetical protein
VQYFKQHSDQKQLRQRLLTFELHDPEHLYRCGNLLGIRQLDAIDLHECRHLLGIGQK